MGPTLLLHAGFPNGCGVVGKWGVGDFLWLGIGGIGEEGNSLLSISLTFSVCQRRALRKSQIRKFLILAQFPDLRTKINICVSTFGLHARRITIKYVSIFNSVSFTFPFRPETPFLLSLLLLFSLHCFLSIDRKQSLFSSPLLLPYTFYPFTLLQYSFSFFHFLPLFPVRGKAVLQCIVVGMNIYFTF